MNTIEQPNPGTLPHWCACMLLVAAAARVDADAPVYATLNDPVLAALIEESLSNNPRLLRARTAYEAEGHRIAQVTALEDPTLGITWHARRPETRTGSQTKSLSISQQFPWPGKRSDRGRIAEAEARTGHEVARALEWRIVRDVKEAYYDLAYLDRAIAINAEQAHLLHHYESLAQVRYAQGIGPQQGAVRLQAEITRVLKRRHDLTRARLEIGARLNALRDHPIQAPVGAVSVDDPPRLRIDGDRLRAMGRKHRPEIRAARLLIESDRDRARLARRRHWPDFTVGASWGEVVGRRDPPGGALPPPDNGKDVYSLTLGVNLPIYRRRYDAAVREANVRLEGARAAHRDTVVEVDLAVRNAGLRVTMVDEQLRLFETALLPQAEQALSLAETAYSTGTAEIADLLDSEDVLFEVRLGLARLKSDYLKALAEVEWAIAAPFPEERS